jgi:hypothetical protein
MRTSFWMVIFCGLIVIASPSAAFDFETEAVPAFAGFDEVRGVDMAIAIDGTLHLCATLYPGDGWEHQVFATEGVPQDWDSFATGPDTTSQYCSIDVDTAGNAYLAFQSINLNTERSYLEYLRVGDDQVEVLSGAEGEPGTQVGMGTRFMFDGDDRPHIATINQTNLNLEYHYFDQEWKRLLLADEDFTATGGTLSLWALSLNQVYLGFHDNSGSDTLNPWIFELVNGELNKQWLIDGNEEVQALGYHQAMSGYGNEIHFAYNDGNGGLLFKTGSPGSIEEDQDDDTVDEKPETIDTSGTSGYPLDIAIDSVGGTHVCYGDQENNAIRYAVRDSEGWGHFDISTSVQIEAGCAIEVFEDRFFLAYGTDTFEIRVATGHIPDSSGGDADIVGDDDDDDDDPAGGCGF